MCTIFYRNFFQKAKFRQIFYGGDFLDTRWQDEYNDNNPAKIQGVRGDEGPAGRILALFRMPLKSEQRRTLCKTSEQKPAPNREFFPGKRLRPVCFL